MTATSWVLLGAPWDCSGTGRGEQAAPDALRRAGLTDLVEADLGNAATVIDSTRRDSETGVRAMAETVRAATVLADAVAGAMEHRPGRRPLVVGGDCSILLGIVPALRRTVGPVGLWFVDGHPDYLDGLASGTGETADMDLAALPAVSYPQPAGPDWAQLADLLAPLTRSPRLLGVSIADFRPDLDPAGRYATAIVELLRRTLP